MHKANQTHQNAEKNPARNVARLQRSRGSKMSPYSKSNIELLQQFDEISPEEQGFMLGYLDACEEE